jgi:hypothetical protein
VRRSPYDPRPQAVRAPAVDVLPRARVDAAQEQGGGDERDGVEHHDERCCDDGDEHASEAGPVIPLVENMSIIFALASTSIPGLTTDGRKACHAGDQNAASRPKPNDIA